MAISQKGSPLNRQQMEDVLKRGGSVLHKGVVVTDPKFLPSAADLAADSGDSASADAARAANEAEIERLRKENDALRKVAKPADAPKK